MASGTPWGWIAGGVGVAGLWWLSSRSSAKASSSPRNATSEGASPIALPSSTPPLEYYSYIVKTTGINLAPNSSGPSVSFQNGTHGPRFFELDSLQSNDQGADLAKSIGTPPGKIPALAAEQREIFNSRFLHMSQTHDDFSPAPDKYSKSANLVFRPEHTTATQHIEIAVPLSNFTDKTVVRGFQVKPWGWYVTDEYGRVYEGWGAGGGFDFLQVVSTVSNAVLPWIPGYGTAANIAIQATIAIAQGKSMKEVALTAARAALPGGAAFAFDLGVGIVIEGKSPKDAVVQAAVTELDKKYPGAKLAFEQGQSMAKQASSGSKNVNGLSFGGVFS